MKNLVIALLTVFGFTNLVSAQKTQFGKEIPAEIIQAFQSRFPGARQDGWERKKDLYRVNFTILGGNDSEEIAAFDTTGKWVSTSRDFSESSLPKTVLDALSKSAYDKWTILNVEQAETADYKVLYVINYKNGKRLAFVSVLPDGTIVKKEEEKAKKTQADSLN